MLVDRDSFTNEPTLAKLTFPEPRCRSQLGAKSLAASRCHDEFGHISHDLTKHGAITRETLGEEHAYMLCVGVAFGVGWLLDWALSAEERRQVRREEQG
jgi:hypothetical protein